MIPCALQSEKDYENDQNKYNHNFEGKYCHCDGGEVEEVNEDTINPNANDMLQCLICEDWYHQKHLQIFVSNFKKII